MHNPIQIRYHRKLQKVFQNKLNPTHHLNKNKNLQKTFNRSKNKINPLKVKKLNNLIHQESL